MFIIFSTFRISSLLIGSRDPSTLSQLVALFRVFLSLSS